MNSIKKLLYFSCQICKSLFLSLLNSHQILADSHFSLEGFFFYFSFFGKISCCVLLPVSPSWEVLHKTWWLLNWARDCAAYLKKEDNFSFSLYTLAKINLLCMKYVGTQWTMVSYLKKNQWKLKYKRKKKILGAVLDLPANQESQSSPNLFK